MSARVLVACAVARACALEAAAAQEAARFEVVLPDPEGVHPGLVAEIGGGIRYDLLRLDDENDPIHVLPYCAAVRGC